jgi:membrane protease YdiL (CAAX protease family)
MKRHLFVFIKALGFFTLWILLITLQSIPGVSEPPFAKGNMAIQRFWWELLPLISVIISTLLFTVIIEKNSIKINLLNTITKNSVLGIIIGIEWIGIPILILSIIGSFHFGTINSIPYLFVWIISAFLNVIMQEYLVRGYIFELLKREYNLITSIIITSIIFTGLHGGAFEAGILAVLNVVTMSIFMSLLLLYAKSLFLPIIVHAVWNIVGSLLGCVSLASDYPILINCIITGEKIISGGIYKLEGSIFVLLVNIIHIIVLVLLINRNKSNCT